MELNPIDQFVKMIRDAMATRMGQYGALSNYDESELIKFLKNVFGLNNEELSFILNNLMKYNVANDSLFIPADAAKILLDILFAEIALRRKHLAHAFKRWKERMISLEEFIDLVLDACFWMPVKPSRSLLEAIFAVLDEDKDGFISYKTYVDFIRKFLSGGKGPWDFEWDIKTPAD